MYRAAVFGLGNISWLLDRNKSELLYPQTHAYSYLLNEKTILVGGCSPVQKERNEFSEEFEVPVFSTPEELLENLQPDIVSVCSPSHLHASHLELCLNKKISMVWLEKPPAMSLSEIDHLLALEQRSSATKILVNYQRRYMDCYKSLRQVYRSREFGDCRAIQINYSRGLENNGSHLLDILFFIVGEDVDTLEWVSTNGDADSPSFVLRLRSGVEVFVCGQTLPYHCLDIVLVCEGGRVSVLHGGMTPVVERREEHELFPGFFRLKAQFVDSDPIDFSRSFLLALQDLLSAREEQREPLSTLASARMGMALVEEVRSRSRQGGC